MYLEPWYTLDVGCLSSFRKQGFLLQDTQLIDQYLYHETRSTDSTYDTSRLKHMTQSLS